MDCMLIIGSMLIFFLIFMSLTSILSQGKVVYLKEARKLFLNSEGQVNWDLVKQRWDQLKDTKQSLGGKFYTKKTHRLAQKLSQPEQQRLLNVMMGGLSNPDSSVGVYANQIEDYDDFSFYLEPLIREYHQIQGDTVQKHDWNIPTNTYLLTKISPTLKKVSMRSRVARNVVGWRLPPSMNKKERLDFQSFMQGVFDKFQIPGKYYSLTPGHPNEVNEQKQAKLREKHFLFNDMTTDNHLTSSGIAGDWPYGRGVWVSKDETKMIWVGEEDHLRIITIIQGLDLGAVDVSLKNLLDQIQSSGVKFAQHPIYGVITTCPTNMGTGKRQSIFGNFPNISKQGTDEKALKQLARSLNLQARGKAGEHSQMDKKGTADISPTARFGVTEKTVTKRLYEGLTRLYQIQLMKSEL